MNPTCHIFYRKPGRQDIQHIQGNGIPLDLKQAQNHFVIAPFLYPNEKGIMVDMASKKTLGLYELSQGGQADFCIVPAQDVSLPDYRQLVSSGIQAIHEKRFSKVVLSRKKIVPFSTDKTLPFFLRLCEKYPNAFVHLISFPEFGTWMGASPELLLEAGEGKAKTVSLAGTQQSNSQEDWGEKEKEEQDIVTRFISSEIEELAEDIQISSLSTAQIGPVSHIKKEITFIPKVELNRIVDALHPTPAVCGMPKKEARAFILQNEGYERSLYAGFIGEWTEQATALFVNLRCMQVFEKEAHLYLGAGITQDSEPESEFVETENKSKVLLSVLGLE
ncbi:MAG: chorismate-binding protein [Bacteroidota bacterium]